MTRTSERDAVVTTAIAVVLSLAALLVLALPRGSPQVTPAAHAARPARRRRGAAGHRQAVLRQLPQRPREDGRRQLRRPHARRASRSTPTLFEKAVRKMRGRVMPPPGARQPDAAAADSLVAWLEAVARPARPARRTCRDRVVLHRLNRKEYANAVRDLLAVEFDAAELLPADDVADGFDNIAAALQVSPSFIEQYVIAARARGREGDGPAPTRGPAAGRSAPAPGTQLTHVPGLPLGTRGGILANVDLPSDGEYVVDIADMVTHIWGNGMEFENPLVVTLDDKVVYETVIGGEEDMKLYDQVQNGALDSVERAPEEHPLHHHRRPAQDRRGVPAADLRRVRRPAADVRARRRPGPDVSHQLVPGARAVQRQGR